VETVGVLRHAVGGQRPAGAGDYRVRIGGPGLAQILGVRVLLHHVVHEPVVHFGRARLAQQGVQLVALEGLRAADQDGQQPGGRVAGRPELAGEVLLRLQPLGDGAQAPEVHPVVVAVSLVHLPGLRVLERRQLGHHLGHRRPSHPVIMHCATAS
jgi:hypothetical protein